MKQLRTRKYGLPIIGMVVCSLLMFTSFKPKKEFFKTIRTEKIHSDLSVEWKNFGPGMAGYCEEFWIHPTDPTTMFMGPDMHVSFGTWDNGQSWHTIKDCDGLGQDMKRVLDIEFSLQNPDFGMAIDWNGWVFKTVDKGHRWERIGEFGESYKEIGIDPNDPDSFKKGWYAEQRGTRHSELAVDPSNENVWYVGAGDFWNVKSNHRSLKNPYGVTLKYAAYGYVWKTEDKGKTWKKITKGIPSNTEVGKIIIHPNHSNELVMATNVGLLNSNDRGLSWEKSGKGLPNNSPRDLTYYVDKKTGKTTLYLVEQSVYLRKGKTVETIGGMYKSSDFGKTWQNITGDFSVDLTSIHNRFEIDRFYKTIGHWFGLSKKEVKNQISQLPRTTLPVFNRIVVNPLNPQEIYVTFNKKHDKSFGPGDVWKTEDGGKHWFVCARQGAYWKSGVDDSYWKKQGSPVGTNVEFAHLQPYMDHSQETSGNRTLAINLKGEVFIGIDQQTLKSVDHGKTWKQVDDFESSPGSKKWIGRGASNLPGRFMLLETGIKDRKLLCSGEHGLWQTTTDNKWRNQKDVIVEQIEGQVHPKGAHSISTVAVDPKNPNVIYYLAWRQKHRGTLRKSTDGGKTWKTVSTIFEAPSPEYRGLASQNNLIVDPNDSKTLYFCSTYLHVSEVGGGRGPKLTKGTYGFYRSTDGGISWESCNKGLHEKFSMRRFVLDPNNSNTIYAASNDRNGGLYVSKDKGSQWKKMTIPSEIKAVNNVFIDRNTHNLYISCGQRSGTYNEGGVWRSKNNGKSWEKIFKAPFVWQAETSPLNPDLIVISAAGQSVSKCQEFMNPGVYLSENDGKSWKKINKGLGQPDKIVDVKPDPYNPKKLWCASWGCGWFTAEL